MENMDSDDEARRAWMEAEDSCFWEEEPGEPGEEPPAFLPMMFGGIPNVGPRSHRVLDSEKVCEGHIFDVEKLHVELPDGKRRFYDLVRHGEAVVLVPVTADGNILFVRQYRIGAGKEILEVPAGCMNPGEEPLTSAVRELREETGFEAGEIRRVGGFYMTPGYCTEYLHIYLARELKENPLPQDDDEFITPISIPVQEAYRMAENGEFEDSKTFAALMMVQQYIR